MSRIAMGILLTFVAMLLAVVILTLIALSSQDLINWAGAPTGLDLPRPWPVLVFIGLDAAAGVCVLLAIYCAWRGEPAGIFGILVWLFALGSALANFRRGSQPGATPDAIWFFPLMSVAGPGLLEAVLGRFRRWFQRDTGRRNRQMPAFGWRRWTPGLGAPRDTYGAYRSALLLGIDTVEAAITAYHQLCPDGSLRAAAALRQRHARQAEAQVQAQAASQPPGPNSVHAPHIPVDLMRRIPANAQAYQRWLHAWADLKAQDHPDLNAVAQGHGFSKRQIEFIRTCRAKQSRTRKEAPMLPMRPELLKGHLDTLLLAVLEAGPQHGYAVIEALRRRTTPPRLPPHHIRSTALGEQRAIWDQFSTAVTAVLGRRAWPATA